MLRRITVNYFDKECIAINLNVIKHRYYSHKFVICSIGNLFEFQIISFYFIIVIYRRPVVVIGIETSCDDTGCAIVNSNGQILGESQRSQIEFHNK